MQAGADTGRQTRGEQQTWELFKQRFWGVFEMYLQVFKVSLRFERTKHIIPRLLRKPQPLLKYVFSPEYNDLNYSLFKHQGSRLGTAGGTVQKMENAQAALQTSCTLGL